MIIKKCIFLGIILTSSASHALGPRTLTPIDATYSPMNKQDFHYVIAYGEGVYVGSERWPNYETFVCAGLHNKTPGKLVNGYCYYPSHGDEKKNSTYFMLIDKSYQWKLASLVLDGDKAITSRAWDGGDYSYHCRYTTPQERGGETFSGKYLPGTGACYYANNGDEIKIKDENKFDILITY